VIEKGKLSQASGLSCTYLRRGRDDCDCNSLIRGWNCSRTIGVNCRPKLDDLIRLLVDFFLLCDGLLSFD